MVVALYHFKLRKETKTEDLGETDNDASKECPDAVPDEKTNMVVEKDVFFNKLSLAEIMITGLDKWRPIKPIQRKPQ